MERQLRRSSHLRNRYLDARAGCEPYSSLIAFLNTHPIFSYLSCSIRSPLKLSNLLHAAATVLCYEESDDETLNSAAKKFQFFQGEDDGKSALDSELAELATLEKDEPALPEFHSEPEEGVEFCIPQRLLLLARQAEASDD